MLKTPNKTVIETTKNIVIKHKHKPFLFTQSMLEKNNMKQVSRVFVKYISAYPLYSFYNVLSPSVGNSYNILCLSKNTVKTKSI